MNWRLLILSLGLHVLGTLCLNAEEKTVDSDFVQAQIADPYIDMRSGPGKRYPIVHVAEQGEWIEILKSKTTWYKIRLANGITGWASKTQLSKTLDVDGNTLNLADPEYAAFLQRSWEVGVLNGDFAGASSITVYGGYHLTQNLSSEIALTQALGNFSEIRLATINILNEPFPKATPLSWIPGLEQTGVSPFFGIGVGVMETHPRATLVQTPDRQDNVMFATTGVKVYLTRQFLMQLEYRNLSILTNRNDNEKAEEWKLGFSIFF